MQEAREMYQELKKLEKLYQTTNNFKIKNDTRKRIKYLKKELEDYCKFKNIKWKELK